MATRAVLPAGKGLIGFVGGPWTLFVYAMEGSHAGAMRLSKSSWALYREFAAHAVPLLDRAIAMQLDAGADVVMVLDTAAGDLPPSYFGRDVAGDLMAWRAAFQAGSATTRKDRTRPSLPGRSPMRRGPDSDSTHAGISAPLLTGPRRGGFVQGNFDPAWLFLPDAELGVALQDFLAPIAELIGRTRAGWVCGLGHGVLPGTPESSVRRFVATVREVFA